MKLTLILICILPGLCMGQGSSVDSSYHQNNDSLMKVLQAKLDSVQVVVNNLSNNETQRNSAVYEKTYRNARTSIDVLEQLNSTVYSMLADRNDAEKYSIISQVNSPASNQLGFTFSDKVVSISDQVVNSSNILPDQRQRLKTSISTIVEGLKNSFPPLNIVTTVVSTLSSFSSPSVDKLNKKMKEGDNLAIKMFNPVSPQMLKNFADSIMPYIIFYQSLNDISIQFQNDLKNHKVKYSEYYPSISNLKSRYANELHINISGTSIAINDALDNLYERSAQTKNDAFYVKVISKPDIQKLNDFSSLAVSLAKDFKPFYDDYYRILIKHFDDNLAILKNAKKLSGSDSNKIDDLIKSLNNLRTGTDNNSPGFELKFKKNLEKIIGNAFDITPTAF
ncbi:hypothetical protein BH20BAC1_BH20BAC1_26910 [soil metagenome]